jgi:hypothetical protein
MKTVTALALLYFTLLRFTVSQEVDFFSYIDKYGNTISFTKETDIPSPLNLAFIEKNLHGSLFTSDSTRQYNITIQKVKTIKKNQKYELGVFITPEERELPNLLESFGFGYFTYTLSLRKESKGKFEMIIVENPLSEKIE